MDAIEPNWRALIAFGLAWMIACVGFFFVSGSLPIRAAPKAVQTGVGPLLIGFNLAGVVLLAAGALVIAVLELRVTSLIVFGGLIFLFAPFAIQDLPARLKDTQLGLCLFLAIEAIALIVLSVSGAIAPLTRVFGS
jgi:hypothetical protein